MNYYFDYIMYMAFEVALRYENLLELSLEQLHKYRVNLINELEEYFSQFAEFDDIKFKEYLDNLFAWHKNLTDDLEQELIQEFLKKYPNIFTFNDGHIHLADDVTIYFLENEKFELGTYETTYDKLVCGTMIKYYDSHQALDIIGATTIKTEVLALVGEEKEVEKAYLQYPDKVSAQEVFNKASNVIRQINKMAQYFDDDKLGYYHRTIARSKNDPEANIDDYSLLSDEFMASDKLFSINSAYIETFLYNMYQMAIYGKNTLVYSKLNSIFEAIWSYRDPEEFPEMEPVDEEAFLEREEANAQIEYHDEFEADDDFVDNEEESEEEPNRINYYLKERNIVMAIYLNFIVKIDDALAKFGNDETLVTAKKRLLYILDSYGKSLYIKEYFNEALANVRMDEINIREDLDNYYELCRMYLIDILEGWSCDEFTLRKILFVATYYDLTKDKRIERILNKYQNAPLGYDVYDAVFNHNYAKFVAGRQDDSTLARTKPND